MRVLHNPALAAAVGISAISAIGLVILAAVAQTFAQDFGVYHRVAVEPFAMAYLPHGSLPFPYAPTMILWVEPLSLFPKTLAFAAWLAISAALLWKATGPYLTPWARLLALASPPMLSCFLTGQVSVALAAVMIWACASRNRWLAGVLFGVVASIKPQLVLLAPVYLIVSKDWRAFVGAGLTYSALVAASLLLYGVGSWVAWIASLSQFNEQVSGSGTIGVVVTPAGAAQHYGLPGTPFNLIGLVVGLWVVIKWRGSDSLSQCASITTASLLAAPYALVYDLSPVVPFLSQLAFRGQLLAAFAMSGAANPFPLVAAAACGFSSTSQPLSKGRP